MIKRTVYFGNPAFLHLRTGQMEARISDPDGNDKTITFPIEDLGFVVLDHPQITITQGLIDALVNAKCALVSCSKSHLPTSLMLPLSGNILHSERVKSQLECSLPLRKQMWRQTVQSKIANQQAVLNKWRDVETGCMSAWSLNVTSGDTTNLEGRAAAYYWKNLFGSDKFVRDRDGDCPNNFLNYGYAVLRAIIARALVCAGLLPIYGIHHHSRYDAYCLADDIMEPYRPVVDDIVLEIIEKYPNQVELTKEIKVMLLSIPVKEVVLNGIRRPLMIAASETALSVYKCFKGEIRKISYPVL